MPVQTRKPAISHTGKSVYIVDDDSSVRTSMKRLLRGYGIDAKLFASAGALFDHGDFQNAFCIILDIDLDKECGIALRRRLAGHGVKVPVIFVTGNDSAATRSAAIASGCLAYLTKPFSARLLIDAVEKASELAS